MSWQTLRESFEGLPSSKSMRFRLRSKDFFGECFRGDENKALFVDFFSIEPLNEPERKFFVKE